MSDEIVLIKFGGSLITDKSNICEANYKNIKKLCRVVSEIRNLGKKIILVHGAGSFGHIKAKKWKLSEGIDLENEYNQLKGVEVVRSDMIRLNEIIVSELKKISIESNTYIPHEHGEGIGIDFEFSSEFDKLVFSNSIPITYGDVVDTEDDKKFGILSGDDICEILCKKYNISHVIFAIAGADGLIDNPNLPNGGNLIEEFSLGDEIITKKVSNDVTGGMDLKITRALNCLKNSTRVSIINGEKPDMIVNAVKGNKYLGTELIL